MTLDETMQALREMGTEQNRKVYARHGAGPNTFGVSFANLGKLKKQIRTDHSLARELWASGNTDAMTLATMVADPSSVTAVELDGWLRDLSYYMLAALLAGFVAKTPHAAKKREQWTQGKEDLKAQTGWNLVGFAAMQDTSLDDAYFAARIAEIESKIHLAKNRTRHAMNGALIAIGMRNESLKKLAVAAARRIGKVVVDHGETGCVTPDAIAYIDKAEESKRRRQRPR